MPVLSLLLLLTFGALATAWLRRNFRELRRVCIGGAEEDLPRARGLMRSLLIAALVLLAILVGLIFAGERWAGDWRQSLVATSALNGLLVALGWGLLQGASRTLRNQWSSNGSYSGMFMGMAEQAIFMILLVPAFYWRLGFS
jgi:hypothetical protein